MNNKKKLFLGIAGVGLLGLVGAGVGLLNNVNAVETKAAGETLYYRGNDTSKTADWEHGNDSYTITEGAEATTWTFIASEQFKFYSDKDGWEGSTYSVSILGSASALFSGGGEGNIYYNGLVSGTFDVLLSGGNIYFDYQDNAEFYYVGSDAAKQGSAWTSWTEEDKVVKVNGSAVTFSLAAEEKMKLRPEFDTESWNGALGYSFMENDYFSCFKEAAKDGNIECNYAANYDVRLVLSNHQLQIKVSAHDSFNTVYVLDLYGDLLNVSHKAHIFNGSISSTFPGVDMSKEEGNDIYGLTYWDDFTNVNFNQKGDGEKTGQTINLTLTGNENKCLILNHDVNGEFKWNSNTWISLAAAQFIDQKMHFGDYNEDQYKTEPTANCASYYGAAKTAYNALASNAVRKEVLSIEVVKDRLSWWATANGDTLDVADGAALPVAGAGSISGTINNSSMNIGVIAAILATAVISIGSYFIIKKKHEN